MNNLLTILEKLKSKRKSFNKNYYIPKDWNVVGYDGFKIDKKAENEIIVNPYDFMIYTIEKGILSNANKRKKYNKPLDIASKSAVNIFESTVYSMLPRMFTAWDHYKSGELIQGSFVKSLCLIPYLKQYNIDIIYYIYLLYYS